MNPFTQRTIERCLALLEFAIKLPASFATLATILAKAANTVIEFTVRWDQPPNNDTFIQSQTTRVATINQDVNSRIDSLGDALKNVPK